MIPPFHRVVRGRFRGLTAWLSAPLAMLAVVAATLFATAQDAPWEVVEVAGEVQLNPTGGAPRAAAVGDMVGPGDAVETGDEGRARLTRAADAMTLSPNSRMMIPLAGPDAPSVLQRLGTLLFEIDSRFGIDRFRVETPYLAAVIKGTVFTVTVGPQGGALSVVEGLVEVRRPGAPQPVLVQPGATVRAPAGQGGQLDLIEPNGDGDNPPPAEPGDGDQGSREDDRGNGSEKAEAESRSGGGDGADDGAERNGDQRTGNNGKADGAERADAAADQDGAGKAKGKSKAWKIGFDPGIGDVGKTTDGFLKNKRDGALDGSFATTDPMAIPPAADGGGGEPTGDNAPPGQGGTPPGHGGTPPGRDGSTPGQGGTLPGQAGGGNPNPGPVGGGSNANPGGNPNPGPVGGGGNSNPAGNPHIGGPGGGGPSNGNKPLHAGGPSDGGSSGGGGRPNCPGNSCGNPGNGKKP